MGGYGSGRKFGLDTTDDYHWIDIRRWQREGYLTPGRSLAWQWLGNGEKIASIDVRIEYGQVRLIYNYRRGKDAWESLDYPVMLQTTACHYGGVRYWFTCPASNCGRRVAKLYLGGKIFACRHCYQLAYQSQRETTDDRATRKLNKICDKLHWQQGIFSLPSGKPKGMHWRTYQKLTANYFDCSNQVLSGMMQKLKNVDRKLTDLSDKLQID